MTRNQRPRVVVMGVSGAGKSTIGRALADALEVSFLDGDDLHPPMNIEKMSRGVPLDDQDRLPWLRTIGSELQRAGDGLVVACSALKRSYRDVIRNASPSAQFVLLELDLAVARRRLDGRTSHFMPTDLLDSQFAELERPLSDECSLSIDADLPADTVVETVRSWATCS